MQGGHKDIASRSRRRLLHQAQTKASRSPSSCLPSLISAALSFSCMMDPQLLLQLGQTDSRERWMCQSVSQSVCIVPYWSGALCAPGYLKSHWPAEANLSGGDRSCAHFISLFSSSLVLYPSLPPPPPLLTSTSKMSAPRVNLQFGTQRVNK